MVGQMERRDGRPVAEVARTPKLEQGVLLDFADNPAPHPSGSSVTAHSADPTLAFRFRNYSLSIGTRLLVRGGEPVEIGGRAFDLLYVLLCARGNVVDRLELMRRVWPTTVVEESNLRFQVACARRALGVDRDLIKTVAGRGYFFLAEPDETAPGGTREPFEAAFKPSGDDPPKSPVPRMSLPRDPTGAQTPEDYRASCELMRELLNTVLCELRELRNLGQRETALSCPGHGARAD
jgi:DNA-binding winged helix-turn-helix (wHTH) protein